MRTNREKQIQRNNNMKHTLTWILSLCIPVLAAAGDLPLSQGKPARASSVWGVGFEAGMASDGNDESRWGAAPDARSGWLEIDLGKDTEVACALIRELGYQRTNAFAIECGEDGNWREVVAGNTIAGEKILRFKPVTARYFRLNIRKASGVPTIEEFQLFAPGTNVTATPVKPRDPKLKWFDEAKYGLFINWGLYSIPAGEWKGKKYPNIGEWIMHDAKIPVKEYEQLAPQFNPDKFNAEEWARLAEDAGMKYLVFDCKHHDGFALYHSEVSKYNCYDATPWKRDPMRELQAACDKHHIKLCFYYSQATDWHEPNGGMNNWDFKPDKDKDFDQYLRDKSLPQVKELLSNYGPIGLIWFDVPVMMTAERSKRFADLVHSIQPGTLINSRLGQGSLHDYQSMGDKEIPSRGIPGEWQTAATINDTWGDKKDDHNWKQPDNITFKLVDIVSKGGNYLLNVGPAGDGSIPQPSQDILRRVGKWLKVNGESIYGAGKTPWGEELEKPNTRWTVQPADWTPGQPGRLYLHLFKYPTPQGSDGNRVLLTAGGLKCKFKRTYMLADPERSPLVMVLLADGFLSVNLPDKAPDELDSVLCVEVE